MKKIIVIVFLLKTINCQVSFLDQKFNPIFRLGRTAFNDFVKPSSFENGYRINLKNGKTQVPVNKSQPFFCAVNGPGARSYQVPDTVHKLTPGDIDVVGALGDSLTAGNGILATDPLQILVEGRGMSFAIGGQADWRKFLTIPNIIKEFNPKLYGYSLSDASSFQKNARFNTAEPGAQSMDIPHQANNLVKRMRSDKNVDLKNSWKMVSIVIGGNDFCLDICYHQNQDDAINLHDKHLTQALRTIRDNLPRTMVNVALPPDVSLLLRLKKEPQLCTSIHYFECPCLFSPSKFRYKKTTLRSIKKWKAKVVEVVNREEFHNRPDFTVNLLTFSNNIDIPTKPNGASDYTYLSIDCFHLSQKGNARVANSYWNNLMEPEGRKTRSWETEFKNFKCPTVERPYISTRYNS